MMPGDKVRCWLGQQYRDGPPLIEGMVYTIREFYLCGALFSLMEYPPNRRFDALRFAKASEDDL